MLDRNKKNNYKVFRRGEMSESAEGARLLSEYTD